MIWGYATGPADEHGLHEMKEISFGFPPAALRDIALFLQAMAAEVEKGTKPRGWHGHIDGYVRDWAERFPEVDIVVVNVTGSTPPPKLRNEGQHGA